MTMIVLRPLSGHAMRSMRSRWSSSLGLGPRPSALRKPELALTFCRCPFERAVMRSSALGRSELPVRRPWSYARSSGLRPSSASAAATSGATAGGAACARSGALWSVLSAGWPVWCAAGVARAGVPPVYVSAGSSVVVDAHSVTPGSDGSQSVHEFVVPLEPDGAAAPLWPAAGDSSPVSSECHEVSSHVELHGSAAASSGSGAPEPARGMGRVNPPGMELFAEKPGMPWFSVLPVSSLLIEHSLLA